MKTIQSLFRLVLFFALATASPVSSQSNSEDAHLTGTITDTSGGGVGGVRVTAQQEGVSDAKLWTATSATDGSYRLSLPAGRYRVHFSRDSFSPRDFTLDLAAGESRALPFRLDLEPLSANVIVTAQALPVSQQQTTAPTTVVTRDDIDNRESVELPALLQFSPGAIFGRTGAHGGGASLFLDGGNSNFTKVLVDGSTINPPGGAFYF